MRTKIVSFGVNYPSKVVTNKDLEAMMDTTDEWIQQRSGIKERRWVTPDDTASGMAVKASQQALARAGLKADDIDAIIYSCLLSDYVFPGGGVQLQHKLGFSKMVPALDIRNQCTGFLYALQVADAWIRAGMYKRVLIATSEVHSTSLDVSTRGRDIAVLFGDAGGACIVEACDGNGPQILDTILYSEGQFAEKLSLCHPSPNSHPRLPDTFSRDELYYPVMDGKFVFKNAVSRMCESLVELAKRNKVGVNDIDFVIAHQANQRIIQMVLQQLGVPETKTHYTLDRFGNTTSTTIPLTWNEAEELGKVKRGQLVALTAFGSGFTWGASLVRF
ncbi:MAG TPA: ketoacyl-ACP synthase III [Bdellovibrionales bacterium]|nr:ketoacyl-ACP synthase III [Bdellovibrionales bacterium]